MKQKSSKELPVFKKNRSCAYPMLSLPQAIAAAKSLCDNFGEGPYSRASAAKGLGYSSFSGAASSKIGSLVHYGLLERAGGMYSVASLAKICFSYPEDGSREAITAMANKPVLYHGLISRFLNKSLPEKLEAILVDDYGITGKAAPGAAQNFVRTMEFAGLIREGRLAFPDTDAEIASIKNIESFPEEKKTGVLSSKISIKLTSGIEVLFPDFLAYRLSMGEFAPEIKNLDAKAGGV